MPRLGGRQVLDPRVCGELSFMSEQDAPFQPHSDRRACGFAQGTAYDQVLTEALHYPDVWYDYAAWHVEGGGGGSAPALAVLHRGRRVRPSKTLVARPNRVHSVAEWWTAHTRRHWCTVS
jgi:hypothetical protein